MKEKLKIYHIFLLVLVLIVFVECVICISLFVYKMESKNTIKDGYINYTNHKYDLSKASIDEIQSKMKLNILNET
jgi:hypothetical protein